MAIRIAHSKVKAKLEVNQYLHDLQETTAFKFASDVTTCRRLSLPDVRLIRLLYYYPALFYPTHLRIPPPNESVMTRTLYYGYAVSDEWLLQEAARLGIQDPREEIVIFNTCLTIMIRAGLFMGRSAIKRVTAPSTGEKEYWCFTLASNDRSDNLPNPRGKGVRPVREESYQRLKQLLGRLLYYYPALFYPPHLRIPPPNESVMTRTLYYGYAVSDEWLLQEAARLGIRDPREEIVIFNTCLTIMIRAGLFMGRSAIKRVTAPSTGEKEYWCFTLASNDRSDNLPNPRGKGVRPVREESYQRLKQLLGLDHEPCWYPYVEA
ncbi:hypothetical protein PAXINDRAFT_99638 [Paxillus involutus ATCC 200175]|uniref:Uncharacterized protein n=1 Tax=Paxillus involutus ATCC 200175 TaxID=664439 RepID=A0A0C9THE4_PAXIN|nr:hypothetical protein PAXINDRAFT_99638 [Paxillus involutus ATCC 200175]